MHILHLTQLPYFFSFFFSQSVKSSSRAVWVLFPPVLCAASPFPRSGCWEVKRERADGVAFSKKCGITGASWWGDGERNCARCVDRVGGGWKDGVRSPGKKGGEGTPQLPVLPLTPLSLCLSADRPTVWEAGPRFPQADAHPPPLFEIAFAAFPELHKLNCNNLPPLMRFSFYLSLSKKFEFSAFKKRGEKKENQSFFSDVCLCLITDLGQALLD